MKIIKSKKESFHQATAITIGTFDGVHIGHQKIISRLINTAKKQGLDAVILTFFPHPRVVLQKDTSIKLINTLNEKAEILENLGLDILYVKEFTQEFSRLTAEDFVSKILVNQLNVKKIIIGYDHHFGRNRTANIDDLIAFGKQYNFEVEEITAQEINDVSVSSTKIRQALLQGDIKTANSYLGYHFMLNGSVVKGKGLGHTIGFPTANIQIDETYKLIPKHGVYVVSSIINNKTYYGMMNIGVNPTVSNDIKQSIEVHFFNFDNSIYGNALTIKLLHRLRDEIKFESVDALKEQLKNDEISSKLYLENNEPK
ncbi:bifunctional riboflavin kinase/FAD synthetase [Corallibacter sp.]|uniref:bifunctional riboflavin kinase/FAD synthetase n=1 Tax=Corallibacter sp. TaxID=2038084 RepID=UPI003AB6DD4A